MRVPFTSTTSSTIALNGDGPVTSTTIYLYPQDNLYEPAFVGYHEPVAPTRPMLGGVAAALVMGAALAAPRRLSRRALLTGGLLTGDACR